MEQRYGMSECCEMRLGERRQNEDRHIIANTFHALVLVLLCL